MSTPGAKDLPSPLARVLDQSGRLDPQWIDVLQSLVDEVRSLRALTKAQQATLDDHEQRITDLEP
ncbi:MAG: hypothetical protein EA385_10665 [Salinarimonadaceae bacterium]|nr:MAG: hypothetical protein EA385_10665 [Salinarimonadaceae bacterium]